MNSQPPPQGFLIFLFVWIALGIGSFAFFSLNKNSELKRRVFLWFSIGAGLLFIGATLFFGIPATGLLIVVPAVCVITFLNVKHTRFCDSCKAINISQPPFFRVDFCRKCGGKLEKTR